METHTTAAKPIIDEFFDWIDRSPFFGKNTIVKAAEYTISRKNFSASWLFVVRTVTVRYFYISGLRTTYARHRLKSLYFLFH
jgi:hypothetical protein